jgi:hypothetical protein
MRLYFLLSRKPQFTMPLPFPLGRPLSNWRWKVLVSVVVVESEMVQRAAVKMVGVQAWKEALVAVRPKQQRQPGRVIGHDCGACRLRQRWPWMELEGGKI